MLMQEREEEQREEEREWQANPMLSEEPDVGLDLTTPEIMT